MNALCWCLSPAWYLPSFHTLGRSKEGAEFEMELFSPYLPQTLSWIFALLIFQIIDMKSEFSKHLKWMFWNEVLLQCELHVSELSETWSGSYCDTSFAASEFVLRILGPDLVLFYPTSFCSPKYHVFFWWYLGQEAVIWLVSRPKNFSFIHFMQHFIRIL